jgi:tetratricopeptide (TPR) repeat protein
MSSEPTPGTVIAGRFIIEQPASRGGMGSVFRAKDTLEGRTVALKFMNATTDPGAPQRFVREAEVLAELRHPGIVTHVAHGLAENGQPFLAMEWLEGESLEQRLLRQPMSLSESLLLLRRVAEALAVAHERGIIHRDLKPSNLFLRGGLLQEMVVLDFGLARHAMVSRAVTGSAMVLGTPAYMAPEQASCQDDLTPSVDVFSLGCVLYECLTGQMAFMAPHLAAVLAKILFAEPPPLRSVRGELPARLQVLVDRMLAKNPKQRLPDAMSVLEALDGLERLPDTLVLEQEAGEGGMAGAEQKLVSVLLVRPRKAAVEEAPPPEPMLAGPTVVSPRAALLEHLRMTFSTHGAQVALLADDSLLVTLVPEQGVATDQAALAARCALSIKERWPTAAIVLCTGRGIIGRQTPVGEVMDRVGQLLRQLERTPAPIHVLLDEVTAGLLGPGFQLDRVTPGAFMLRGEQLDADASRLLLGRPTPCVGREQELSLLELAFDTCAEDESARALLVVAPAGTGKSRLRHEFLRRLEKQGREVLLLLGRGDSMRTSAYGLIGQAMRRLCGIQDGEALESRQEKLRKRLARYLSPTEAPGIIELLGEMCGIPFPDEHSPQLRAARMDPRIMSAQMVQAFVSFLRAESTRHTILLVLEDLHWADARTVQLVDEALRALSTRPMLVLALARPEVRDLFPGLWRQHLQELVLRGISRKAGARLIREVLGPEVSESVIERVVEQAAGNALFLEEHIRMVAEGQGETPPATVLAMLQGRIQRLEAGERQVLLSASFFGPSFWAGGVKAVMNMPGAAGELEQRLRHLVELEVVEQQPESHFPSEKEYRFRHALLRDAAYGLVPDSHKAMGHQRAGAWLEQLGEPEPRVLAEHYHLGQDKTLAIPFYIRAAEQLYAQNEWRELLRCVEAGQACGATGAMQSRLRALQATVVVFRTDNYRQGYEMGSTVLAELKPGSIAWCMLAGPTLSNAFNSGNEAQEVRLVEQLLQTAPEPDATSAYVETILTALNAATVRGSRPQATAIIERIVEVGAPLIGRDGLLYAKLSYARSFFGHYFEDRVWQTFTQAEQALRPFRELGQERSMALAQFVAGCALASMGNFSGAAELLHDALAICRRAGVQRLSFHVQTHMALALAWSPEEAHQAEARDLALEVLESGVGHALLLGRMTVVLAKVAAERAGPHEAEPHARKARELLARYLPDNLLARTVLSTSLRAQGRIAEAREEAQLAVQELERMGAAGFASIRCYLALAEACFAEADRQAGEVSLRNALQCLRSRDEDIQVPEYRKLLLLVPEHARAIELARQQWGEDWKPT